MIRLILRADDIGYSEAVNYGIEKSVKDGLIGSAGLMPNMPAAAHGLSLLEGTGICVGQHTNVCLGKPCADPAKIPSLLDENGNFLSSRAHREAFQKGKDLVDIEQAVLEVEAQYHRFVELTGQQPGYFEAHAIASKNLSEALRIVAEKYELPLNAMTPMDKIGKFRGKDIAACNMESMKPDYEPFEALKRAVAEAREDMPNVFVCHPGYLDDFILRTSSLTVNRTKEVAMLCAKETAEWLEMQGVELITYAQV